MEQYMSGHNSKVSFSPSVTAPSIESPDRNSARRGADQRVPSRIGSEESLSLELFRGPAAGVTRMASQSRSLSTTESNRCVPPHELRRVAVEYRSSGATVRCRVLESIDCEPAIFHPRGGRKRKTSVEVEEHHNATGRPPTESAPGAADTRGAGLQCREKRDEKRSG